MNRFNICQAYAQLESDYNVGGWLRERPSNQRRMESIDVQLHRVGYTSPYDWIDIEAPYDFNKSGPDDEEVREIYMSKVLEWNLPISAELMAAIKRFFTTSYVAKFSQCSGDSYLQG